VNLTRYVGNVPTSYVDPDGLERIEYRAGVAFWGSFVGKLWGQAGIR
jgi:hypothetical protein